MLSSDKKIFHSIIFLSTILILLFASCVQRDAQRIRDLNSLRSSLDMTNKLMNNQNSWSIQRIKCGVMDHPAKGSVSQDLYSKIIKIDDKASHIQSSLDHFLKELVKDSTADLNSVKQEFIVNFEDYYLFISKSLPNNKNKNNTESRLLLTNTYCSLKDSYHSSFNSVSSVEIKKVFVSKAKLDTSILLALFLLEII